MSDEPIVHAEETARYFPKVEESSAPVKKKRGRPAKSEPKLRHDVIAEALPVDGDYERLALANEDPEYTYFWVSERDLARLHRPWIQEKWASRCCRPKFWFGDMPDGTPIVMDGLHLMKMPKRVWAEIERRDPKRANHRASMKALTDYAKTNGKFEQRISEVSAENLVQGLATNYKE
jgi:hypothetical protein